VTGAAGFIGYHLAARYLERGDEVVGVDNVNDYYDVTLKDARIARLMRQPAFRFFRVDIADRTALAQAFDEADPAIVLHMAAQAGVRYSMQNPYAYGDSNLGGFLNVLEQCRRKEVRHLVFASSSSVYGANTHLPYSIQQNVDHPISLYAATKKANELMAHAYSHLYSLPTTGLRFFTVYGPWGRPDMAYFKFTRAILAGEPIDIFNHGEMQRDFTFIDDVVEGVVRVGDLAPGANAAWSGDRPDPGTSRAPYRLYNIGNHTPVPLLRFVEVLESLLKRTATRRYMPLQDGDVVSTFADVQDLQSAVGFAPSTPIADGLARFVRWYREYHEIAE
jgi:UDP-glucuronate 4-epimerase